MSQEGISASVSFESLLQSIAKLSSSDKLKIMEALNEQLEQAEEDLYESDPSIQAQIREARVAYAAKNYVTLDDYLAGKKK
ncbi:hypothetical protein D4R75_13055 [bacterium]|nr:MAG: hypothetical protein D4R75_13055 [bacterium]